MASYTTTANVVLNVNGQQARKMIADLQSDASDLEKRIAAAAAAGDKVRMKKLQQELNNTRRLLDQLQGRAFDVSKVLAGLDRASPRELNKALRQLQMQLNSIERGSEAWNAQIRKIQQVRAELDRVNRSMTLPLSRKEQLLAFFNKWQTAIAGAAAAAAGLVMAGQSAVKAYAGMEQEMANVRKYTGMTADDVARLNDELRKINTRTSREDLNIMAQEAGRLGKTSAEDILGYVRAADKINVALDDLGSGATLTLSKLTGIFGDEARLGTEKSLLAVGSVINELSQNCSASAPYLAEFASRMGGVGAQAGMTVQQIMGLAAVLDSNNQKLEASSTAISQVIVRIYQDPAKYARVAGLDVQKFADLVRSDMNAALIEFLSALDKAGNMDILSPMFKEMGENGSRAIAALSTLANNISDVVAQQNAANEAFAQATSIDTEFEVQNNTVQAGLDKAKNHLHEISVELGEKLIPVMKYAVSSSTVTLKVLSALVTFLIQNKNAIAALTITILSFTVAVKAAVIAETLHSALIRGKAALLRAVSVAQALYSVAMGNTNIATLRVIASTKLLRIAMLATPWGIAIAAITALVGWLAKLAISNSQARKAAQEHNRQIQEQIKGFSDLSSKTTANAEKEIAALNTLYRVARNEAGSRDLRLKAMRKMMDMYPDVFSGMSAEQWLVHGIRDEYLKLRDNILEAAKARAVFDKIQENEKEIFDKQIRHDQLEETHQRLRMTLESIEDQIRSLESKKIKYAVVGQDPDATSKNRQADKVNRQIRQKILKLRDQRQKVILELNANTREVQENWDLMQKQKGANARLSEKYAPAVIDRIDNDPASPAPASVPAGSSKAAAAADKFLAEKQWRQKQEALARISYLSGETDLIRHTEKMNLIEVEYQKKRLAHTDLSEQERLDITVESLQAQEKQQKFSDEQSMRLEEENYLKTLADIRQKYIDSSISRQTYDQQIEQQEILHQRRIVLLTREGSDERLKAEQRLQEMLIADKEKKQKELQDLEKKYQETKSEFFGLSPAERRKQYDDAIAILDTVYDRELKAAGDNADEKLRIEKAYQQARLALAEKYGLQAEQLHTNAMQKAVADSIEWLNSDGGKALTAAIDTVSSSMSAIFSALSSSVQAELELQTAAINSRYEQEVSLAEGNSYRVAQAEKRKEKDLAKAKNEANRKSFSMQVIQAVAQTATNALNAYGSAAAVPLIGYILAPIAAASAVAAGAIQIAAIKKQQQAAEAQGYEQGGFTAPGPRSKVAGIVHAGEWVASQKLVSSPVTRPIIDALEYAQRYNRVSALSARDVSRAISIPAGIADAAADNSASRAIRSWSRTAAVDTARQIEIQDSQAKQLVSLSRTIDRLDKTLSGPILAVTSITGEYGYEEARRQYQTLLDNKNPRNRISK